MKNKWKFIGTTFVVGLALIIAGIAMGAKRNVYIRDGKIVVPKNGRVFEFGVTSGTEYSYSDGYNYENDGDLTTAVSEKNLESFDEIEIKTVGSDIYLLEGESFGVEIYSDTDISWSLRGGRLKVEEEMQINIGFSNSKGGYVKVYIPKQYMKRTSLNTASGNIITEYLLGDNFSGNTVSGEILVKGSGFEKFQAETTSGVIKVNETEISDSKVSSTSGEIDLKNVTSNDIDVSTTSGSINLEGNFVGENDISTISGSVDMFVNGSQSDYEVKYSTVSGGTQLNGERVGKTFKTNRSGRAPNNIEAETVSGGIKVTFSDN